METRFLNENSIEYVIASAYSQGKGYLFELFFGWRGTKKETAKMVFSRKDWQNIDTMVKYYNKFVIKEKN